MQVKLTIGERLKDLRVEQKLTLEQLAAEVGISKSALGKYESDNGKDISPYSILLLADYYGVSCDYLMGRTETKNHPNTALHELHLSDASIDVLRTGKFNHRLLSELICHKDFQRFMLDAEIYVDRIADMRVNDMNAVLEAVRQMALMKNGGEENDLHLRTLEVAQIREDEYFGSLIADDLKGILRDIRSEHRPDTMTADETSLAATMQGQLQDAMTFEGSSEEKKAKARRDKLRSNLLLTLTVIGGYLFIYLAGRIFTTTESQMSVTGWLFGSDPQQLSYLYGWLLRQHLFWVAMAISALPALFGKRYFSFTTLLGFAIALLLGELCGHNPAGAAYGHGHYGWAIWGFVFAFSVVMGMIPE